MMAMVTEIRTTLLMQPSQKSKVTARRARRDAYMKLKRVMRSM